MSRFKLTYWQRRRLLGQLKMTAEARRYRRTLAVLELDRGRPAAEVTEMLGVTRQSVYNWADAFAREHAPSSLADAPRSASGVLSPDFWLKAALSRDFCGPA
jgi:transposase